MRVLRDAALAYRTAVTAAGLVWPERTATQGAQAPDLDLVHRLFDVDHVPEQLTWLASEGWDPQQPGPEAGWLLRWPTDVTAGESLDLLSFAVGTPFHWRHQIPLFRFARLVFTFVVEGDHEGEIWRYLISPDLYDPVRAAPSLAALVTEWTKGIASGVVYHRELDKRLRVGEPSETAQPFEVLRQRAPELDPLAFPIDIPAPTMRERQRECGVDLDCVDRGPECQQELEDDVDAVRASLGL
ncbi:hypothetical protein ABZS77_08070 [Micromonospora sp. NPDC005298]|uniref:hypothetical protein n=1 Tax=Micromonospora sp. NPDC005298 TaxID=3156873 RepID=UPI0033A33CE3